MTSRRPIDALTRQLRLAEAEEAISACVIADALAEGTHVRAEWVQTFIEHREARKAAAAALDTALEAGE